MRKPFRDFVPHIVVFNSSMGIMIIELLASRIISKYFGNSLYTWTGIIGIVLAGISLGNYLGGKIADRRPAVKSAPVLLLIASGLTLLLLLLDMLIGFAMDNITFERTWVLILTAVGVISLLFFLPSTALGTISPVMAKYALERNEKIGSTVGGIYASGAAGSIVGTFLSGFVLVPLLGIRIVVFVVAALIASLTLLIRVPRKAFSIFTSVLAILFFLSVLGPKIGLFAVEHGGNLVYKTDSMYSHIRVEDRSKNRRVLIMDGLVHNMYDRTDPDILLYEYERIFEIVTEKVVQSRFRDGEIKTLTLGGGALTFPSYIERHYPKSINHVVEIDPKVVKIAHRYFDIPRETDLTIHVQDARQYVRNAVGREKFDIIYLDVFNSFSIPSHLTTKEFTAILRRLLVPDGILCVNLIDIFSIGKFIGAYSETVSEVFPYCAVYTEADFGKEQRSTFVLLASREPVDFGALEYEKGERFFPISSEAIDRVIERNNSKPLTDNHAPVENLIAPVFLDEIK